MTNLDRAAQHLRELKDIKRAVCLLLIVLNFIPFQFSSILAQDLPFGDVFKSAGSSAEPQIQAPNRDDIALAKADSQAQLQRMKAKLSGVTDPSPDAVKESQLWEQLGLIYDQQLAAITESEELPARKAALASEIDSLFKSNEKNYGPNSFLSLDAIMDLNRTERERVAVLEQAVSQHSEFLSELKAIYQGIEKKRRALKEAIVTDSNNSSDSNNSRELELLELESRTAQERVNLRSLIILNEKTLTVLAKNKIELVEAYLRDMTERAIFTEDELNKKQAELQARIDELGKLLEKTKELHSRAEQESIALNSSNVTSSAEIEAEKRRSLELAARGLEGERQVLTSRLQELQFQKDLWLRRFKIANHEVGVEEQQKWRKELTVQLNRIDLDERRYSNRLSDRIKALAAIGAKLDSEQASENVRWFKIQQQSLERETRVLGDALGGIEALRRTSEKVIAELDSRSKNDLFKNYLVSGWSIIRGGWDYELTSVDDSPITLGKIFFALGLIIAGFALSRRISRKIAKRLLPRLRFNRGAISAIESITFYLLIAIFALIALRIVHIPLTVFTILGGALAIGIGFGSQNIMNNFISGLIMLAEQPVRVGDIIEFNGIRGTVRRIGARSTQITTGENFDTIVPNSILLQSSIVNWTLTNNQIRRSIIVGVAYGSPTAKVSEVLLSVANEHSSILRNPPAEVLFRNFGDSSLEFDLRFWIAVRRLNEALTIESELRHVIDRVFREESIVIAFPQQDIHFDTSTPLSVRIINASDNS